MKDLKAEFEQIYSLSIRSGEDSATVWNWLIETMLAAADWVSCKNSLPESEGEYLTYNKANDSQTVQYFDGRVWGYLATVKPDVTHWTKLLPAPACKRYDD